MELSHRVFLKVGSLLLDYPDYQWRQDLNKARLALSEFLDMPQAQAGIKSLEGLAGLEPFELESHYVQLFDFSDKRNLYLTRQEVGDDRRRGQRMVEQQQVLFEGQCAILDNTLPDYLPAWLEYLGVAQTEPPGIAGRVAYALTRIIKEVSTESPYYQLLQWLLTLLPQPDGSLAKEARPTDEERDMPFPLLHGDLEEPSNIWEVPRR